jgi:hypothetical protein
VPYTLHSKIKKGREGIFWGVRKTAKSPENVHGLINIKV